jgi:TP901 family phage tail tape measure protein
MAREIFEQEYRLIDRVSQGLKDIAGHVRGLKTNFTEVNQAAELVKTTLAGFNVAFGGVTTFQDSLAELQAVTQALPADFEQLKEAAVSASERTRFSSTEAAQGLTELARAGLSAEQAIAALNPVLNLAQGNNISVAQSAELVTTTIKQFGASMDEAARFSDVLQATADRTSTSVEQIGNAMSYVAPLARQAGASVEETSAIIGALADQGFRGERAGTALRNVFSALSDPASKFNQALRDAGIESRDFAGVISGLATDSDRAKQVLLALDSEARPAIQALVNSGGEAIGQLRTEIESLGGAAQRTSDIMGATLGASLEIAKSSLVNARNAFLEPLLAPLSQEVKAFAEQVNLLAKSEDFDALAVAFAGAVTKMAKSAREELATIDFKAKLAEMREFADGAKEEIDSAAEALGELTRIPLIVQDTVTAGSAVLVESFAGVANDLAEISTALTGVGENAALMFDDIAVSARAIADENLVELEERLGGIKAQTEGTAVAAEKTAAAFARVTPVVDAFGNTLESMLDNSRQIAPLFNMVEQAAITAASAEREHRGAVDQTTRSVKDLRQEMQLQIERMRGAERAYEEAFAAGSEGANAAFEEVQKAGRAIAELRRQLDGATVDAEELTTAFKDLGLTAQADLENAAKRGAAAFDLIVEAAKRNQATQADVNRAFEQYARRLAETAEFADEATRQQIIRQIELAAEVGNVSSELRETALAGLRAGDDIAKGGDRAAESWRRVQDEARKSGEEFDRAGDRAASAADRVEESARRQTQALQDQRTQTIELNEEWRVLAESIGVNTWAWDRAAESAQLATERMKLRRKELRETADALDVVITKERELQAVQAAPQIGGLDPNATGAASASERGRGSTGGRGTTAGQASREPAGVVINVQGLPTDQAGVREWVQRLLVPELQRLNQLSR